MNVGSKHQDTLKLGPQRITVKQKRPMLLFTSKFENPESLLGAFDLQELRGKYRLNSKISLFRDTFYFKKL